MKLTGGGLVQDGGLEFGYAAAAVFFVDGLDAFFAVFAFGAAVLVIPAPGGVEGVLELVEGEVGEVADVLVGKVITVFRVVSADEGEVWLGGEGDALDGLADGGEGGLGGVDFVAHPLAIEFAGDGGWWWPATIGVGGVGHVEPELVH